MDGKKLCLMSTLLIFLTLLCIANLVILVMVFSVFDITSNGMSSMSFFKNDGRIKWLLAADFENILLDDAVIGGFADESISFNGDMQNVTFAVENLLKSSLSVTSKGTFINTQRFKFVNPNSKSTILGINGGERLSVIGEFKGKSIETDAIKTPRVVSGKGTDLHVSSQSGSIYIVGNEGLYTDSKAVNIQTDNDLLLHVKDQAYALELNGFNGGVGVNYTRIPSASSTSLAVDKKRYRLCVCTKTKELFRAEITSNFVTCAIAKTNPC